MLDLKGPRLFVFGGTADGRTTEPGLFVLDARPGNERWTQLTRSAEPERRSSGIGFYDPRSDRVLLGFGNSASAVFQDWSRLGY